MKNPVCLLLFLISFFTGTMACKMENNPAADRVDAGNGSDHTPLNDSAGNRLRIKVGSNMFTAILPDNATVKAFKTRLPITLSMKELNGNEKFAQLAGELPTNASNPGTIQAGDLMLYGSNTLVLFYETFRTSYSYTKIGRIDNLSGLAAALGPGNVTVSFEME